MKFFCKNRGSISLFLAAILLPCLAFAGLLVDSANLHLSRSIVESSGEMAASSALANYDTVLNDVYGLFAITQKEDVLQGNVEGYFTNTLQAGGLLSEGKTYDSATMTALQAELADLVGSINKDDVNKNFLNVESSSCTVQGVSGSALSNPDILRNQIVEFMKYRGPAEVGLDLLGSLSVLNSADSKSDVAEAKVEVDEAIGDLTEASKKFFVALNNYNSCMKNFKQVEADFKSNLSTREASLREANKKLVKLIVGAPNTSNVPKVEEKKKKVDDVEVVYYVIASGPLVTSANFEQLSSELSGAFNESDLLDEQIKTAGATYDAQDDETKAHLIRSYIEYINLIKKLDAMVQKVATMDRTTFGMTMRPDESVEDYNKRLDDAEILRDGYVQAMQMKLKYIFDDVQPTYTNKINAFSSVVDQAKKDFKSKVDEFKGWLNDYASAASKMNAKANEFDRKWYQKLFGTNEKNHFEYTIACGEAVKTCLKNVTSANTELKTQLDTYAGKVSKDEYYAGLMSEAEQNDVSFNDEDVNEIIAQVKAADKYINGDNGVLVNILATTFYNSSIKITDSGTILERGKGILEGLSDFDIAKEEQYYNNYYKPRLKFQTYKTGCYVKQISEANITLEDGTKVNVPGYYVYLLSNFDGGDSESCEKSDNIKNNLSNISEESVSDVQDSAPDVSTTNSYLSTLDAFTKSGLSESGDGLEASDSGNWGSGFTAVIAQFKSMISTFKGVVKLLTTSLEDSRDNLLATEYAMQNFSYATIEKEKAKEKDSSKNKSEYYQTMTNHDISPKNNSLYGCELEYLVGGYKGSEATESGWWFFKKTTAATGPELNVSLVKGKIYAMRFVLNSIYALTDGTIDKQTLPPATAIQAATSGFVPYQLAQVVIKLGLALIETSFDMDALMDGEKVPLYKNKDTWICQIGGNLGKKLMGEVAEEAVDAMAEYAKSEIESASKKVNDKFEQVLSGAIDMTGEELEQFISDVSDEIHGCVVGTLDSAISNLTNIAVNEIETCYYQIYTASEPISKDELISRVTNKLKISINGDGSAANKGMKEEFGAEVVDFLNSQISGIVTAAVETSGVYTEIEKVQSELNKAKDGAISITKDLHKKIVDSVSDSLKTYLEGAEEAINKKAEEMLSSLETQLDAAGKKVLAEGKDALMGAVDSMQANINKTLKEKLGDKTSMFNDKEDIVDSDSTGSVIDFSYKDYLRLFIFLEMTNNSDKVIGRIADLIQINVRTGLKDYYEKSNIDPSNRSSFEMKKAYTYVEIDSIVNIKPLLLSQDIFVKGIGLDNPMNLWSYKYQTVAGY